MQVMQELKLDVGVVEFAIAGGGALRFNPADPNLYGRFSQAAQQLSDMEQELVEKGKDADPRQLLQLMNEADRRMKQLLDWVFGEGNDLHRALGGVSLLAVSANGKTVAANLFAALEQVLEKGAQALVDARVDRAKMSL